MAKFERLSWADFDCACSKVARFVRKKQRQGIRIANVYGIPRGGLGMALRLSHLLGLPIIVDEKRVGKSTLVVDEICDTGRTLFEFSKRHGKRYALIATVYHRKGASFTPDYYLRRKTTRWVLFPWETPKSTRKGNR
jgi:hypoxanthine phosphoribosyltransferase